MRATGTEKVEAVETGASNFYVERTLCAVCNEPTVRIGLPDLDAMRGKEPVVCGFCLVEMPKTAAEQTRRDAASEAFRRKFTGG